MKKITMTMLLIASQINFFVEIQAEAKATVKLTQQKTFEQKNERYKQEELKRVQDLIKSGGNLDQELFKQLSNLKVLEELIKAGANPNVKDEHGNTPLHLTNYIEMAKVLIDGGADVNAKNNDDYTPLHFAATEGMAFTLVKAGANISLVNKNGYTPLRFAKEMRESFRIKDGSSW